MPARSGLPTATELDQTEKRSCPSGFDDGLMMTMASFSRATVFGSSVAAKWYNSGIDASKPGTSSPCTDPLNQTTAGVRAVIASRSVAPRPRGSPILSRSARIWSSRAMFSGDDTT